MTAVRHVSTIVCTRNRADLLPGVVYQLRLQDYPVDAFEIIVVDNGSTDHTRNVVNDLATQPGVHVRYICESRPGITLARNRGAEVAHYPYLAYLDDDCTVQADWLLKLLSGFDLHQDVVAVGGRVVMDWSQTDKPTWLGSELERMLGANSHVGSRPMLLDSKTQVMESNMALKRDAWQQAGGFLGMEQFGSRHMAAGEVIYLLQELRRKGGRVAFVPQAVAVHRMGKYTRRRFLERGYWQGVSAGMFDHLSHKRSWLSSVNQLLFDAAAAIILLLLASFTCVKLDQTRYMFYLVRANRRLSLVLTRMRFVGDWDSAKAWESRHPQQGGPGRDDQNGFEEENYG